ncbi:hypothetical protein Q4R45_10410, partial [Morganella morganii subsp. sibonii]
KTSAISAPETFLISSFTLRPEISFNPEPLRLAVKQNESESELISGGIKKYYSVYGEYDNLISPGEITCLVFTKSGV